MDCTDIKAQISALIDDEAEAHTRHDAERHLADCEPCRRMLDRAEALDTLVAEHVESSGTTSRLPDNFETVVLLQSTRQGEVDNDPRRITAWTNTLGWLAAAACLALAVSIWVMEQRDDIQSARAGTTVNAAGITTNTYAPGPLHRSFISQSAGYETDQSNTSAETMNQQTELDETSHQQRSGVKPIEHDRSQLNQRDIDTIYATQLLLEMLVESDSHTFAQVENIRSIAEYDNLLNRLAATRERVPAADQSAVFAAESILFRILQGPLSQEDLQELREQTQLLNLPKHLSDLAGPVVLGDQV